MKNTLKTLSLAIASAGLLTVYGCGGSDTASTPTSVTLSGTAATGAAFTDATINVTDSTGATVATGTVSVTGTYSVTVPATAKAPLVLTASRTNADGVQESLVSVLPASTTASTTVNITPITNLIASRLSSSGDPSKLAAELAAGTSTITTATVDAKVTEVQEILAPILTATGTSSTNPISGTFTVDGTGYDRLLDSIKVTIVPATATTTNVEIGVKQQQAEGAAPTVVQFASSDAVATIKTTNNIQATTIGGTAISNTNLVVSGTATLIAAHLAQLNSCFALPLATRINSTITGTSPNQKSVGNASNVAAAECKNAFMGNDPATFKSNGSLVGRDANGNGAFSGIFNEGANGRTFSQGTYEFTRANGDIVVGYKSKDVSGAETYDTFALRTDTDGKLKQIGNQYTYPGGVAAYHQLREFVNQPASNYYSTGYDMKLPLMTGVAYVKVTTPKNSVLTLIPGSDGMVFPKLNTTRQTTDSAGNPTSTISTMVPSGTTFVRVRSEYADTTVTSAAPSARDTNLFFTPTDATEAEISAYANQSVWKFDYYDNTNALLATQNYKTRSRALTIGELRTKKLANLTAATLTDLTSNYVLNTAQTAYYTKLPATTNSTPTWEVVAGAMPPTNIRLFGNTRKTSAAAIVANTNPNGFVLSGTNVAPNYDKTGFNDAQNVASTARTATIPCANGNGELHCITGGGYQAYASMSGLHLWSRDNSGNEFARFYATYNLP